MLRNFMMSTVSISIFLCNAALLQAGYQCDKPTVNHLGKDDSIHKFQLKISCKLTEGITPEVLGETYLKALKVNDRLSLKNITTNNSETTFDILRQEDVDGHLDIQSKSTLNTKDRFNYTEKSIDLKGEGNSERLRQLTMTISAKHSHRDTKVEITKDLRIDGSGYWDMIFKPAAEKAIKKDALRVVKEQMTALGQYHSLNDDEDSEN